jgi:hypothetical protein
MKHRLIIPAAAGAAIAMAGSAAADMPTNSSELYNYIPITVQNCMYDGHTHEFVIYPDSPSQSADNDQQKLDIAHGSSAVLTCHDQKPGTKCEVKVHGSHNQYIVYSTITFYANNKMNYFIDANCAREHNAGPGQSDVDEQGDNMP